MTIHVLHHCDHDGRFAGYCAWRKFVHDVPESEREEILFYDVQYKQPIPIDIDNLTKNDKVYIVDFSYDRQTLDRIYEKAGFLKVLDHHATAEEQLGGAPYAFFDKTKSGALLAWEYFYPQSSPPLACLLVNDYDMWAWKYPDTGAFDAWLHFDHVKQNWTKWHLLSSNADVMQHAIKTGKTIEAYNESVMEGIVSARSNFSFGDVGEESPIGSVATSSSPSSEKIGRYAAHNGLGILHSQLGSFVCKKFEVDLSIGYRIRRGFVVFNLRSVNEELGLAKKVAQRNGGGGHRCAASFTLPLKEGLAMVETLMSGGWV